MIEQKKKWVALANGTMVVVFVELTQGVYQTENCLPSFRV
jgi:hypothetical protein